MIEGADAVRRGELRHMSARFNAMTGRLDEQRMNPLRAQATLEGHGRQRTGQPRERTMQREVANAPRGEAEITLHGPTNAAEEYRGTLLRIVQKTAEIVRLVGGLLFLARSEADAIRFDLRRSAVAGGPLGGAARRPSILLVEDDEEIVGFLPRNLKAEGYAVEVALCGQEGWTAIGAPTMR